MMNNNLSGLDFPSLRALIAAKQQALAEAESAGQPRGTIYMYYRELKALQVELTMRQVQSPLAGA